MNLSYASLFVSFFFLFFFFFREKHLGNPLTYDNWELFMDNVAFPEKHFEHLWENPVTAADEQREEMVSDNNDNDEKEEDGGDTAWDSFMDTIAFPENWGKTAESTEPRGGVDHDEMAGWTGIPVAGKKTGEVTKQFNNKPQTRLELDVDERSHIPILIHIT